MLVDALFSKFGGENEVELCHLCARQYFGELETIDRAVDVRALVKSAGIAIRESNAGKFEGMFEWDNSGKETITLARSGSENRRRFTAAHELGHWLLRQTVLKGAAGVRYRSNDRGRASEEERLANLLAAEILMPLPAMMRLLSFQKITNRLVRQLSGRFGVSRQAFLRRIPQILNTTLIYLNVVPNRFKDATSHAIVDEAIYIVPGEGPFSDRDNVRLIRRISFAELLRQSSPSLGVKTSHGNLFATFDALAYNEPIPNADLLAVDVRFRVL